MLRHRAAVRALRRRRPLALVTGANSGIGLDAARQLAELGVEVVLGCRSVARCEAARGEAVERHKRWYDRLRLRSETNEEGQGGSARKG